MSADFYPMPIRASAGTNATRDALDDDRRAAILHAFDGRVPEPPRPSTHTTSNTTVPWRDSMRSFFPRTPSLPKPAQPSLATPLS